MSSVVAAVIEDTDDIGMLNQGRLLRLCGEALQRRRLTCQRTLNDLYRDVLAELDVERSKDSPHAAACEGLLFKTIAPAKDGALADPPAAAFGARGRQVMGVAAF